MSLGWTSLVAWALYFTVLWDQTLADGSATKGQATVTAAEANVILSMEPSCCFTGGALYFRGDVDEDRFEWPDHSGGSYKVSHSLYLLGES
jgi:hypothetical protein